MKIGIEQITLDTDIYPRIEKSPSTIDAYVEKLRVGVQFPPIEVQQVQTNGEMTTVILDGYHRWQAHLIAHSQPELGEDGKPTNGDFSQIDAVYWKNEILDKQANLNELRLRSIELNQNHGIRLDKRDYQMIAEKIAKDDPELKYSVEDIAKRWNLKRRTVNDWVSSIRAAQKAKRDRIIFKLDLLGWTSPEIANVTGISESRVREIVGNGELAKIDASISDWLSQGKTVEEAASKLEIDATLAWAIYLQGKSDDDRLSFLTRAIFEKLQGRGFCHFQSAQNEHLENPLTFYRDFIEFH
jgi:transposase